MSTAQPAHITERPRVWVAVFVLLTAAFGLLIAATDPTDIVYAPLIGALVTVCAFLAAKGNQVFFAERTEHIATWQRLWVGVLLAITTLVAAIEIAGGQPVFAGMLFGLFVALPVSVLLLFAAKANQVLFS